MLSIERGESALRGDNGIEGGGVRDSAGAEVLRCSGAWQINVP